MKCEECKGACCESFALPNFLDFTFGGTLLMDGARWFRLHGSENGDVLSFECKCTQLNENGECKIYANRPVTCRAFAPGGKGCIETLRERRTADDYDRIKEADDPISIHGPE